MTNTLSLTLSEYHNQRVFQTKESHKAVEQLPLMADLRKAEKSVRDSVVQLMSDLLPVYAYMEFRITENPSGFPVHAPLRERLFRAQKIASDLKEWEGEIKDLSPAAKTYLAYLKKLDDRNVALHAYVRYAGDMHGGRFIASWLEKLYQETSSTPEIIDLKEEKHSPLQGIWNLLVPTWLKEFQGEEKKKVKQAEPKVSSALSFGNKAESRALLKEYSEAFDRAFNPKDQKEFDAQIAELHRAYLHNGYLLTARSAEEGKEVKKLWDKIFPENQFG